MTVEAQTPITIASVTSNGQVDFDFDFLAVEIDDLRAIYTAINGIKTEFTGGTDFTATGLGNANGGTISLISFTGTETGQNFVIYRSIAIERETDYSRDLFADELNYQGDRIIQILQDLSRRLDNTFQFDPGVTPPDVDGIYEAEANAAASANSSASSATDAETAKTGAETARDKAEKWAENPEDDPVETGPDQFSAKHWAGKADAIKADIDEILGYSRMPVGTVHWHLGTTAPSGSLALDGAEVTDLYPDLKAMIVAISSPWGTSAGGHPYLPDLVTNGEFIRAGGPGGLAIGTMQLDQMQGYDLANPFDTTKKLQGVNEDGVGAQATSTAGLARVLLYNGGSSGYAPLVRVSDGTNGTPRTGSETRPRNIAFLPCIKAFGTVDPEGMADLSALLTAIATQAEAEEGTNNTQIMTPLRTWQSGAARDARFLHVRDQKAAGTLSGSNISGTQVRTLNTVVTNEIAGASLAANVITLPAGSYDVEILCPAFKVGVHRSYLRLSGGGAILMLGAQGYCDPTDTITTVSALKGRLVLAATTNLEVAHYTNSVFTNQGLGASSVDGQPAIFTEAFFWKVD